MNEGITYTVENNARESERLIVEWDKSTILARIATYGFVSHMELVALSDDRESIGNSVATNNAIFELEQSGSIERTYETTDQQNVIIGYQLPN